MQLPAPLLRSNPKAYKGDFGHVLIVAGSASMLGAAALSSLAAMRTGAGLVTVAIPGNLNLALQAKISNVIMTMPLKKGKAFDQIKKSWDRFNALAIGPGLGREAGVQKLVRDVIVHCPKPLVIDADALFALSGYTDILLKAKAPRVLTPHPGEMSRLINGDVYHFSEKNGRRPHLSRLETARDFGRRYKCVLLLKGHRTVVASPEGKTYVNKTGNAGMATAGSGDVLTGMIVSLLGQGIAPFKAACVGAYLHGKAGDRAAKLKYKAGLIATDIIDQIPEVLR
jgi:NAD(P)H-hydrate epimerase